MKKTLQLLVIILISSYSFSQTTEQDINNLLNDATFFSNKYITPMTDAAVYQASSGWMTSTKKRKLGEVTFGVNGNVFFVPQADRTFQISNSDFKFFRLENGASTATVQTALGSDNSIFLTGDIHFGNPPNQSTAPVRVGTPAGVNMSAIVYPYLQGSVGLWYGTELIAKYSTKTKLARGDYQVYGFGVKHNLSQYFKSLEKSKIDIAILGAYSKEQVNFDFLDVAVPLFGSIGVNRIESEVDTRQLQLSFSKNFKRFEVMGSLIANNSNFYYRFNGDESASIQGIKELLNNKVRELYKSKSNFLGEISGRYEYKNFYFQTAIAFGKFINTNFSVQYEFNKKSKK